MARNYDEPSGKWFTDNAEECSACYLGHGHDHEVHCANIAAQRVSRAMGHVLWYIKGDQKLTDQFRREMGAAIGPVIAEYPLFDKFSY